MHTYRYIYTQYRHLTLQDARQYSENIDYETILRVDNINGEDITIFICIYYIYSLTTAETVFLQSEHIKNVTLSDHLSIFFI